jgi:cell division protein FtsB
MATYKCQSCGNEVISDDRPSECDCCGCNIFFVSYVDHVKLAADREKLAATSLRLENERKFLVAKNTKLKTEVDKLERSKSKHDSEKKLSVKTANIAFTAFVILTLFSVYSFFTLHELGAEKSRLQTKISELETQENGRQQQTSQLEIENKNLQSKISDLNNSRIDVRTFDGMITSANQSSNPIKHKLKLEVPSKVNIYLYGLNQDADLSIVDSDNKELRKSIRTSSNKYAEILSDYNIKSSGIYYVKVWLYKGNDTSYTLKIYSSDLK